MSEPEEKRLPIATTQQDDSQDDDAEVLPSSSSGIPMTPLQRRTIIFSLCLVQFLSALDITIIATALPTITRSLSASASEYAWVGSSYTLASTALTPIWAKMSDVFGKKSMLILANVVFMAGSLVAALAQSPRMLIGGRTLQGVGSGGIQVLVTIVIGTLFKLEDRAKYYGITAGVWAVASALGPVLGGVFTQRVGWRWCFYINLPFDGASLVLLFFAMKLPNPTTSSMTGLRSLDWIGSGIIVGGTICFLLGLETGAGSQGNWNSAQVICLLVFGILLLAFFIIFEAKLAHNPLIPIRIFSSITNTASFAVTCLHSFVFISYDYFLPLYMQVILNLSPIISGISLFALVIPLTVCTGLTGFFVKRTGNYTWPIRLGSIIMTCGTGLFIDFGRGRQWHKVIIFQILAGMGAGPVFQTPLIALQAYTDPKDLTAAMSAMSFLRSLATSMSIVVGSVLLQTKLGGRGLSAHDGNEEEYVRALRVMWIFYTCICAVMVCIGCFIKSKNVKK